MSHYSRAQQPKLLQETTIHTGKILARLTKRRDEELVLVYRGMSGVATATAMALWWAHTQCPDVVGRGLSMAYVRKNYEVSDCHGNAVEIEWSSDQAQDRVVNLVFIDDFIASGETMNKALAEVTATFPSLKVGMVTRIQNNYGLCELVPKSVYINYVSPDPELPL
jgi:adenine/guanine phosphoribosyltransferase-like PRPP-binding protein